MKRLITILLPGIFYLQVIAAQASPALDSLLQDYRQKHVETADAEAGKLFWNQVSTARGEARNCSSCHGRDLRKSGKHALTGKTIEPMAPSVNRQRLTDIGKINKWFRRNCNWTLARECTLQEKADVLTYLKDL